MGDVLALVSTGWSHGRVSLSAIGDPAVLPGEIEDALRRIARERLASVRKDAAIWPARLGESPWASPFGS